MPLTFDDVHIVFLHDNANNVRALASEAEFNRVRESVGHQLGEEVANTIQLVHARGESYIQFPHRSYQQSEAILYHMGITPETRGQATGTRIYEHLFDELRNSDPTRSPQGSLDNERAILASAGVSAVAEQNAGENLTPPSTGKGARPTQERSV